MKYFILSFMATVVFVAFGCSSRDDGSIDSGTLACGNKKECNYDDGIAGYSLIWQAKQMIYTCNMSDVMGAVEAGVEYSDCAVFLVSEWIDKFADSECGLHCIKSGYYYHAIDLETDEVVIVAKIRQDEIPDEVAEAYSIVAASETVESVQKKYTLSPTFAEELDFNDPGEEISCWIRIKDLSKINEAAKCAPIPLE